MTSDMSKNPLVIKKYDPRIAPDDRWHFFVKVIQDITSGYVQSSNREFESNVHICLNGIISDLNSLIFEVESLKKGYSNILKSMREDLDRLKMASVKMARKKQMHRVIMESAYANERSSRLKSLFAKVDATKAKAVKDGLAAAAPKEPAEAADPNAAREEWKKAVQRSIEEAGDNWNVSKTPRFRDWNGR